MESRRKATMSGVRLIRVTIDDPVTSARTMPVFRDLHLGTTDPRDPLATPVLGDYHVFPSHEPRHPEACAALAYIADFLRSRLSGRQERMSP